MPDALPKLPIERLSYAKMDATAPGVLLIAEVGTDRGPYLSVRDGKDRAWALEFEASGRPPFNLFHSDSFRGRFLAIDRWQLVVDPSSAYLSTAAMPRSGDAFISDGKPGWVGIINGEDAYVGIDGRTLPEPAWNESFVGFREWSIVIYDQNQERSLFRHRRANPDATITI